ncbi:UNVERIFIED_CONTAM: Pentatricopeptide repeat-containing protein [Sesamum radiatum]|uniref:Pentatricopeptide repeat-containing protein n=1 Tax=Sesamum radiatum TaxID=300843 RepID=A0AAW2TUR7_SESRA
MGCLAPNLFSMASPICIHEQKLLSSFHRPLWKNPFFGHSTTFRCKNSYLCQLLVLSCINEGENSGSSVKEIGNTKFKWVRASPNLTEEQKQAISQLPPKMTNRCKALMKQIFCFSAENESLLLKLAAWVKSTSPRRADWLSVLKELEGVESSTVAEHAFTEESFEANIRDYTKIIHCYAKENRLREAENALTAMKSRGFVCDQVTLTALIHMYSKAGNLKLAEDTFEEMKLLGVVLDKRSYGSMIMAYIRAGMLTSAETILREMEAQEIYAGREVYKALLRAYSMMGDSKGAQRVFDAIQLAGLIPDVKICGLLINAYVVSGQSREACIAFENLRRAGLEPNDKCVALALTAYEKESRLKEALDLLIELERDGVMLGKEASALLAKWFQKLGVVEEVELVLRDFASRMPQPVL